MIIPFGISWRMPLWWALISLLFDSFADGARLRMMRERQLSCTYSFRFLELFCFSLSRRTLFFLGENSELAG